MRVMLCMLWVGVMGCSEEAPILKDGTYLMSITYIESDWGASPDEPVLAEWAIRSGGGPGQWSYVVQVKGSTALFHGRVVTRDSIFFVFHKSLFDPDETGCQAYMDLDFVIRPNSSGTTFTGDGKSLLHLCNMASCPTCPPKPGDVKESVTFIGVLDESSS